MCGILGVIGGRRRSESAINAALERMRHRGPDDGGAWYGDNVVLGARRLAILDLTPDGHQPMVSPRTGAVLAYNGEIYNYVELRHELERRGYAFTSSGDTEVLLYAWEEWGSAALDRLNGMWAFVIWDPRTRTAFFARDRLGVKPFYFALVDDALLIGSEPKVLLELEPALRRVDDTALYRFLAEGELYGHGRSFYADMKVLAPGSYGQFQPGWTQPRITRWWEPPMAGDDDAHQELELLRAFAETFEDATKLRLRSDVPVGITLSGGLDSTAVLHAARRSLPAAQRLRAYTAGFADRDRARGASGDESGWATLATRPYDGVELRLIQPESHGALSLLRRIVWHMDAPGYSPAVLPLWHIAGRARADGVKVLLEGQGADELLGGYARHLALALVDATVRAAGSPGRQTASRAGALARLGSRTFSPGAYSTEILAATAPWLRRRYLARRGASSVLSPDWVKSIPALSLGRDELPGASRLEQALRDDLMRTILPGFLHYGDAISMAHSVESRLPFLDYRLVEFCLRMPMSMKVNPRGSKHILRRYLAVAGQNAIANRRDKRGFPTAVGDWLASDGGVLIRDLLLAPGARISHYTDRSAVERLIDHHVAGRTGPGEHLYRLLTTELWLEQCITP